MQGRRPSLWTRWSRKASWRRWDLSLILKGGQDSGVKSHFRHREENEHRREIGKKIQKTASQKEKDTKSSPQ